MLKSVALHTSEKSEKLTQQLNSCIGDFDVLALLRLLKFKGYAETSIRFDSHKTLTSQDRLIERIQLYENNAVITLNMGLLGIQTPLPLTLVETVNEDSLQLDMRLDRLLQLLDHTLILNYLAAIYPEHNTDFFSQWQKTRKNLLLIQNVHSTTFLYWLFQHTFPEFLIRFSEIKTPRKMATEPVTLNHFNLGDGATLGGLTNVTDTCIHVDLALELEHYRFHISWLNEVEQRLEQLVFPLLDKREVYLFILLKLPHDGGFKLIPDSRLGRDLLPGNSMETAEPQLPKYVLHKGAVRLPEGEKQYIIQWGTTCRIQI